jgi:glutamate synthase (ferredoxin)
MTGGVLFLRRINEGFLNRNYLVPTDLTADDEALLLDLLRQQAELVGSETAAAILQRWEEEKTGFVKCIPLARLMRVPPAGAPAAVTSSKA